MNSSDNVDPLENLIDFADSKSSWKKDDRLREFIDQNEYVYNRVKKIKFKELVCVYEFVEDYTPYSPLSIILRVQNLTMSLLYWITEAGVIIILNIYSLVLKVKNQLSIELKSYFMSVVADPKRTWASFFINHRQ